ncbi:uncharacterized protein LOC114183878 [Vigna unguiculata]|nr:uncharacterized protein LOC114183878 [Vigna unguiculata]
MFLFHPINTQSPRLFCYHSQSARKARDQKTSLKSNVFELCSKLKKMQKEQQKEYLDSMTCPSFNYYTTVQLAVVDNQVGQDHNRTQNDDASFEFAAFRDEACFDDAFFPIFNHKIQNRQRSSIAGGRDSGTAVLRFPITGDDIHRSEHNPLPAPLSDSSSSSSEVDELEGVPAATYCVWTPNSPRKCKKSNSTGSSSKKWKLLDLLRRSNSERKESYLFLTAASEKKRMNERWSIEVAGKPKDNGFAEKKKAAVTAHEALYVKNRELRMIDKKKSFLPYKPNLVGFCTRRFGKTFSSF